MVILTILATKMMVKTMAKEPEMTKMAKDLGIMR